jgi:hypothetical protein
MKTSTARKRQQKQQILLNRPNRKRGERVARRASVRLDQILTSELYARRPSPILWDDRNEAFSDRRTAITALVSYAIAASGLIIAWAWTK